MTSPREADDPVAAADGEHAPDTGTRTRWWVWPAMFAVTAALWAAQDVGPRAGATIGWLMLAVLAVWRFLPQNSPQIGGLLRRHDLIALPVRAAVVTAAAGGILAAVVFAGSDHLRRAGAPGWAVDHPHTGTAVLAAAVLTVLAWGAARAATRRQAPQR